MKHEQPRRLLLVEDSDEDVVAVMRVLRQIDLPLAVHRCETAQEAAAYLAQCDNAEAPPAAHLPEIILLDLNLPGSDGHALLEQIKTDARLRHIPVIVLTTSDNPRDIQTCYALGANSYQIKPVDYLRFRQSIQNLIEYWLQTATLSPME